LGQIKEPAELAKAKKDLADSEAKQRDEIFRQERLRSQIAIEKEKRTNGRAKLDQNAKTEQDKLQAKINEMAVDRDRIAGEVERFDGSLARFFQSEAPETWPMAAKTFNRNTLFHNADELGAKKSREGHALC
jgi:hypothetical protein